MKDISSIIMDSILDRTWNGVSEENLAHYVIGVNRGNSDSQSLYNKVIKNGYAKAAIKIEEHVRGLSIDIQHAREGITRVLGRVWNGYSEDHLARFVGLAGNPQELYNEVVRNGFVEATEQIKKANPSVETNEKYAREGITRVLGRVWNGYSEDHLARFVGLAGNPQELFDMVVQEGYVRATMQILRQNSDLRIKSSLAYEGLGRLSVRVGHGYSNQDVTNFLQAVELNNVLKPNI